MSDLLSGLPVATVVNDADELYLVQGGVAKRAPKSLFTASAATDPDILWQWDGTLNDFTNGGVPEVTTGTAGALSLTTSFRGNPAIRMAAGAGAGRASWAIDPAAISGTLPRRFTIEYETEEMDDGIGGKAPASWFGISPFCQFNGSGDILGWSLMGSGSVQTFAVNYTQNTTIVDGGVSPAWRTPGIASSRGILQTVDVEMILGATFDMSLKASLLEVGIGTKHLRYNDADGIDFDAGNYNNETPNTIGLSANFSAASHWVEFTRLTLLRHPADR